jgi:hypothetical protein
MYLMTRFSLDSPAGYQKTMESSEKIVLALEIGEGGFVLVGRSDLSVVGR